MESGSKISSLLNYSTTSQKKGLEVEKASGWHGAFRGKVRHYVLTKIITGLLVADVK